MWMRNIVVNLVRNSNHHLNANVYVFIARAYVLIFLVLKKYLKNVFDEVFLSDIYQV